MTDALAPTIDFHPSGRRYSQEMVDWAYQVWALKAGRSPTRTHRLISDPAFRELVGMMLDEEIPDRTTIEYWSKQYNWLERFHDDMEATGGAMLYQAKQEMVLAVGEGSLFARDLINDDKAQAKDRLKAWELLLSYTMGREAANATQEKPRGDAQIDPEELKGLSTGELMATMQKVQEMRRRGR